MEKKKNEVAKQQETKPTIKSFFERDDVKGKFKEMLGKKSTSFITSVLQITAQSSMLANADPVSVYQAAAVAATLDLPINNNLGFAYIVPYNDRTKGVVAQFQLGYKGYIQLAQRSGQFKTIYASPIYEGQIIESNPLEGYKFDFTKNDSDVIVGYAARFTLLNGYEATMYMSIDDLKKHGNLYSQSFKKGYGLWKDNFNAMAIKTVIKLLLSKFAPLSVEMQMAIITDQSVVKDYETADVEYADNIEVIDKEAERIAYMIEDAETVAELMSIESFISPDMVTKFQNKLTELNKK